MSYLLQKTHTHKKKKQSMDAISFPQPILLPETTESVYFQWPPTRHIWVFSSDNSSGSQTAFHLVPLPGFIMKPNLSMFWPLIGRCAGSNPRTFWEDWLVGNSCFILTWEIWFYPQLKPCPVPGILSSRGSMSIQYLVEHRILMQCRCGMVMDIWRLVTRVNGMKERKMEGDGFISEKWILKW